MGMLGPEEALGGYAEGLRRGQSPTCQHCCHPRPLPHLEDASVTEQLRLRLAGWATGRTHSYPPQHPLS